MDRTAHVLFLMSATIVAIILAVIAITLFMNPYSLSTPRLPDDAMDRYERSSGDNTLNRSRNGSGNSAERTVPPQSDVGGPDEYRRYDAQ